MDFLLILYQVGSLRSIQAWSFFLIREWRCGRLYKHSVVILLLDLVIRTSIFLAACKLLISIRENTWFLILVYWDIYSCPSGCLHQQHQIIVKAIFLIKVVEGIAFAILEEVLYVSLCDESIFPVHRIIFELFSLLPDPDCVLVDCFVPLLHLNHMRALAV